VPELEPLLTVGLSLPLAPGMPRIVKEDKKGSGENQLLIVTVEVDLSLTQHPCLGLPLLCMTLECQKDFSG
jgi:hypothetical protein